MSSTPRKQHRKTRTGCRTCKIRRVKCDETFPACRRCIKLGGICDGYGVWGGGGAINPDTKSPLQAFASNSLMTAANNLRDGPTWTGLRVSSEEQIYLEWFIHGTAAKPPRIFNSPFWDPAILQATIHEPMILQALLALSAAHKRHVLDPVNRAREGLVPDGLEVFLLKHYGSAIKGLQNHLDGGAKIPKAKWFAAVTMCAIFVLFELMRGRFEEACVHLKTGAHIAKQFTREPGQPDLSPQLVQFFIRLPDQMIQFRRRLPNQQTTPVHSSTSPIVKLRFASPAEAGHYLDDLIEQLAYLAQQTRQMPRSATAAHAVHHDVCRYLLSCFESWLNACNATTAERRLILTPSDAAAYKALRQRYKVSKSIAEKCIGSNVAVEAQVLQ
ncbi:hypothetical protein BU25DRAFT_48943 [Macroventuria anomochaeta]|uniref:Uncharacterized protein n=1 Tax=Macroventuria anomochaeta TaxID=301207 RepID=A0ACB6S0K4_9PLEO|nr:uncharacterized protein BU25DRAFT_48943 [Macroventuria anomochaeta]KAF2627497.1 hypothetical protein BU25DRAFT_48943 [Macroventuria anomochaeta]